MQAARLLGVNKTTVSRRLAALDVALGVALTETGADGRVRMSQAGRVAARRAEAMDDTVRGLAADLKNHSPGAAGRVRLTAVPLVVNHLLLPNVLRFQKHAPDVALELIAEARDLDLLAGDADLAIRLARPRAGGQQVASRRIGRLDYACFTALHTEEDQPWIGYEPNMQYLSHAQAITRLAARPGQRLSGVSVNDAQTLLQAVQAGLGKTLLPEPVGQNAGLRRHDLGAEVLPHRDMWILGRRDQRGLARIGQVVAWLDQCLA